MNAEEVRALLRDSSTQLIRDSAFDIAQELSRLSSDPGQVRVGRELLIRAINRGQALNAVQPILDALTRHHGLFPYLNPSSLTLSDLLAYESHRPLDFDDPRVVFHRIQAQVYGLLMDGTSVILSAPTSFGKSLIIDAIISSGRLRNVAVVVPTIALIDETRRRLARFRSYKLVTHPSQSLAERNIIVMTQERLLDLPELPALDLFMIDEFYKLDLERETDRAVLLNHALIRLYRTGAPFYFAGPNVSQLADGIPESFAPRFISTDFSTVAADTYRIRVKTRAERLEEVVRICNEYDGPTLIYCPSPGRVRAVGEALLQAGVRRGQPDAYHADASDWISDNFHPEWLVARAFANRIGLHHGRLPRALAQETVRAFNAGLLDFLVCTSTLIEGVNTRAKNVVILDNKIANSANDFFTFQNIKGRSGRMFQHFVGRVFLFDDPPQEKLPIVDIPGLSQGQDAPASLLVQLDREDISPDAWPRVQELFEQDLLSLSTLRMNRGIDPFAQLELAGHLRRRLDLNLELFWNTAYPDFSSLAATCELITSFIPPTDWRGHGAVSARQLAFLLITASSSNGDPKPLIENFLRNRNGKSADDPPDQAVEGALDFLRYWPGHNFPSRLMALGRISQEVFGRMGLPTGNYAPFAARCEAGFLPAFLSDLEEYGLPAQVGRKIVPSLSQAETLDGAIERLAAMSGTTEPLSEFEALMVLYARQNL